MSGFERQGAGVTQCGRGIRQTRVAIPSMGAHPATELQLMTNQHVMAVGESRWCGCFGIHAGGEQ